MDIIYDAWNNLKKKIANESRVVFCNKREIWWCSVGMNIGTELFGKHELFERPILVLKVYNKDTIFILPLTTKFKSKKYNIQVLFKNTISYAVLSQARTISTKRLSRKIGRVPQNVFENVLQAYKQNL